MYLFENPVLQRELLINLRQTRTFLLLLLYVGGLGVIVFLAWPQQSLVDLTNPQAAQRLVNLFFLGQYLLASMIAPSVAAGALAGEKERQTYEMLLASPLAPGAIVFGKLLASMSHLAFLVIASLPIVVLCLPLGGTSLYEVLAAYLALALSTLSFGMISLACSSLFRRTAAALAVSYLVILPLALMGVVAWSLLSGSLRLFLTAAVLPPLCAAVIVILFAATSRRLLHPVDVGSEGHGAVDEDREQQAAIGMFIERGQFPDSLFAPARRVDLHDDGVNPVLDKEMRSEIFSQGTLMLRVVIQISMVVAIPLMWFAFYRDPTQAVWYVGYVVLFNMLVGPVFSAGSITSERERQTLDLLLTTALTPRQILTAKLVSGLRVSSVLTMFLLWPLLLACLLVPPYWNDLISMAWYVVIILVSCLVTSSVAVFCSVVSRKTSTSLLSSYVVIGGLFLLPVAARYFAETFFAGQGVSLWIDRLSLVSPLAAAWTVPLDIGPVPEDLATVASRTPVYLYFTVFYAVALSALIGLMAWLFNRRWRVAQ